MRDGDTIVALSSGNLPSGVAVIRVSGVQVPDILDKLAGGAPEPRKLALRPIGTPNDVIDSGLIAYFPAPNSFTGEDCAELQVHGSPAVIRALLREITQFDDVRLATAGEFSRRAFENGKLDLTQIEGLGDLLEAETESQRKLALLRAGGHIGRQISDWRIALIDLRAEIEARLDFSDESDVDTQLPAHWHQQFDALRASLREALSGFARGRIAREGFRVALAGPPNAGKSSLINALASSDIAIVSDEPGTTRDVREVPLDLNGQLVVLVDMAGLRATTSDAEAKGIARAEQELERADLVLWLQPCDGPEVAPPQMPDAALVWRVYTKLDLAEAPIGKEISLSSKTGIGLPELIDAISERAFASGGSGDSALISHERDRVALETALNELDGISAIDTHPELAAERLRLAADALARLTGEIDAETILDRLFANFCIGK